GTGIIATALKFERLESQFAEVAIQSMRTLNRAASEGLLRLNVGAVHACTDITGFGLLGHASEMAAASSVTLSIHAADVPLVPAARDIAMWNRSAGLASNEQYFGASVDFGSSVPPEVRSILFDPQTSGGLLIAAAPDAADNVRSEIERAGARAWR